MTDILLRDVLEVLEALHRTGDTQVFDMYEAPRLIPALKERLAHCDRCGKRLGGEGDIHTCSPKLNQCGETCERAKLCATCGGILAQPEQEPFSPESISITQTAWKMGHEAAKAEQSEQEPVAWLENLKRLASICPELNMVNYSDEDVDDLNCWAIEVAICIDGIATPPAAQRTWVGLTPQEVKEISFANRPYVVDMVVALEAKLKEKNCD